VNGITHPVRGLVGDGDGVLVAVLVGVDVLVAITVRVDVLVGTTVIVPVEVGGTTVLVLVGPVVLVGVALLLIVGVTDTVAVRVVVRVAVRVIVIVGWTTVGVGLPQAPTGSSSVARVVVLLEPLNPEATTILPSGSVPCAWPACDRFMVGPTVHELEAMS
jgi:hypothetical protein